MQIPVVIEPVPGKGYQARTGEPLALTAEGATVDEALRLVRQQIDLRLQAGARVVPVEVSNSEAPRPDNPWLAVAGMYAGAADFDAWQKAIADYRQQVEEDPAVP